MDHSFDIHVVNSQVGQSDEVLWLERTLYMVPIKNVRNLKDIKLVATTKIGNKISYNKTLF